MTKEEVKRASERVEHAKSLIDEIDKIELVIENLDIAIKPPAGLSTPKKPRKLSMWFGNKTVPAGYDTQKKASVMLFDSDTMPAAGVELPIDEDFLRRLKNYFQDKLEKKQSELSDMELHEG